jgi:hypothetical protein
MSTATVVAKGKLSRLDNVNYLEMSSFEVEPARKPAAETKPANDEKDKAAVRTDRGPNR